MEALWFLSLAAPSSYPFLSTAGAGAILPLVRILATGTDEAKDNAAGILANLATRSPNHSAIINAGAIRPLIRIFTCGPDKATENAARLVANLSSSLTAIIAIGAIPPLVALLTSGTDGSKANAAKTLLNLLINANTNNNTKVAVTVLSDAGVMTPLVAYLTTSSNSPLIALLQSERKDAAVNAIVTALCHPSPPVAPPAPSIIGGPVAALTVNQNRVLDYYNRNGTTDEGCDIRDVINDMVRHMSPNDVQDAIRVLLADGFIYSTIDDTYHKSTEV